MTPEQMAAFVMAQAACAIAEIEAMKIANVISGPTGTVLYGEADFMAIQNRYVIGHNAVISFFQGGR